MPVAVDHGREAIQRVVGVGRRAVRRGDRGVIAGRVVARTLRTSPVALVSVSSAAAIVVDA